MTCLILSGTRQIRRPFYKFEEITMYGIWIYVACSLVLVRSLFGKTASGVQKSCPIKCDLIQEIQLLRQLLNQESLLRVSTNNRLHELKNTLERSPEYTTEQRIP